MTVVRTGFGMKNGVASPSVIVSTAPILNDSLNNEYPSLKVLPIADCNIAYTSTSSSITFTGLSDPIVTVNIFDSEYNLIWTCGTFATPCNTTETISNLSPGNYIVWYESYDAEWNPICKVEEHIEIKFSPEELNPCKQANKQKTFYLPFPEEYLYDAFRDASNCNFHSDEIRSVTTIKTPYPIAYIKYDHWEDGYEQDLSLPVQTSTEIWGDGNLNNGIAPGYPDDILLPGSSIILDNTFNYSPPRDLSNIVYDGKDKMLSSSNISVSKIAGDATVFDFQAAKTSVYDISRYGTSFIVPLGEDLGAEFQYTALFLRALHDNTTINIDLNGDGNIGNNDLTETLNEGEVLFVDGNPDVVNSINDIKSGAIVSASKAIGTDVLFGGLDCFGTRNINLQPAAFYSSVYYSPVPTMNQDAPARVYFHNSYDYELTINWTSNIDNGTILIPPSSTVDFLLPQNTSAYKFENLAGASYTAIEVIDSDGEGSGFDWAFTLTGVEQLTNFTSIAWAPGSSDGSRNDAPLWVTPISNTTIYIKHDGDVTAGTPFISPCGLSYDEAINLNELEIHQIFDNTDNDQSGTAIFTCDTPIVGVYGEDPSVALPGSPSMDVGTNMEPMCSERLILANEDVIATPTSTPIDIPVLDNDDSFLATIDPTKLSVTGLIQPSNGTVSIATDYSITYTPTPEWQGTENFEYEICALEDDMLCDKAIVTVYVGDCNATPISNIISGYTFLEQPFDNGTYDGEQLLTGINVSLYNDANENGLIDPSTDLLIQTTTSNISGYYAFVLNLLGNYIVQVEPNDGAHIPSLLSTATASFSTFNSCENDIYLGVNSYLEAVNDTLSLGVGYNLTINILENDLGLIDTSTLINGSLLATNGTVIYNNDATIEYQPNFNFIGTDSFEYQICSIEDPNLCDEALVIINVSCPGIAGENIISGFIYQDANENGLQEEGETGQANTAINLYQDINQNGVLDDEDIFISSTLSDTNGAYSFSPTIPLYVAHFVLEIDRTSVSNTFMTTDNIEVAMFTSVGESDCLNNFGILNCVDNCPPEANDDEVTIEIGETITIDILANDFDSNDDLDPTSVYIPLNGIQPSNGILSIDPNNGAITYTPNPTFSGVENFEYIVCDLSTPIANCDTALVTINVFCPTISGQNLITGTVFVDTNQNGIYDLGEAPGPNVTIQLYEDVNANGLIDNDDNFISDQSSDANGEYSFSPLLLSTPQNIEKQISNNNDDAMENLNSNVVSLNTTAIPFGRRSGEPQVTGLRFNSIDIPAGAYIQSATIEFQSRAYRFNYSNLSIYGEATDDAAPFTNTNNNLSNRSKTEPILWNNVPGWFNNQIYNTPNIATIVQEIIDRPNWVEGNNMAFLFEGTGNRWAHSNEGAGNAPKLIIEYATSNLPAHFVLELDVSTLPTGSELTTDNIEITVFPYVSENDCVNDFGYTTCIGGCQPMAVDDYAITQTETPVTIDVLANDWDGDSDIDPTSISIPTNGIQPTHGTVSINSITGEIEYTPNDFFQGSDSLTYQVCDFSTPVIKCDEAIVRIDIVCTESNEINGIVFEDENQNGFYDSTESGTANAIIRLYEDTNQDGMLDGADQLLNTTTTLNDGTYSLINMEFGPTQNLTLDISSNIDDAEERANGNMLRFGNDLEMIRDGSNNQTVGLRFTSITIPQGAMIDNAYIEFYAKGNNFQPTSLNFFGENTDDAGEFPNTNSYLSNRPSTSATVQWNNIQSWFDNSTYSTPDLSPIIQELVDRPGWNIGNDLAIIINGSGRRRAESFDSNNGPPPRIVIEYRELVQVPIDEQVFIVIDESTLPADVLMSTNNILTNFSNVSTLSNCAHNFGFHFPDNDQDGILDHVDLDDDNDGIPDLLETPVNPLLDSDNDGVPIYLDDDDNNPSMANDDGLVAANFDTDNDNTPNHFDLDSDGDGCFDVVEAGHNAAVISNSILLPPFGVNGLSNSLEDNDSQSATINYTVSETILGDYDFLNQQISNGCNQKPIARNDINATEVNRAVTGNVLTNDYDPDEDDLFTNTTPLDVINGNLTLNSNGDYTFFPTQDFVGTASFIYIMCDSGIPAFCQKAKVEIDIIDCPFNQNNQVIGSGDHFILENDNILNANLLVNDSDPQGDNFSIDTTAITSPALGSLTIYSNGDFSYEPNSSAVGTYQFQYKICDDAVDQACDTVEVTLEILMGNGTLDLFATDDAVLGMTGDTLSGMVTLNDNLSGWSSPIVETISQPQNGTVNMSSTGLFSFFPTPGFTGNDQFIYKICDTNLGTNCDSATVYLTVIDDRILLDLKVMLQGALYGSTDGLMRNDLVTQNLVPLIQPYSGAFNPLFNPQVNNRFIPVLGGNETTTNALLQANLNTPDGIVDWVFIELKDAVDSTTVIRTVSALLQRDGDIVDSQTGGNLYVNDIIGEFFVCIKHRNHFGVMTASPNAIIDKSVAIDFTQINSAELYNMEGYDGLEQTSEAGVQALWSGNANADDKVKYDGISNDRIILVNEIITAPDNIDSNLNYNNAIGYFQGDINMDGKAKYDGVLNDRILIQFTVLTYPKNNSILNNYSLLIEQVKY